MLQYIFSCSYNTFLTAGEFVNIKFKMINFDILIQGCLNEVHIVNFLKEGVILFENTLEVGYKLFNKQNPMNIPENVL